MIKKFLLIGSIAAMLLGCSLTAGQPANTQPPSGATQVEGDNKTNSAAATLPAATAPAADVTGPGGDASVTVSAGVILLTPGAPLPTPDLGLQTGTGGAGSSESQPTSAAPAAPQPTSDASSVQLPNGLPVYPGALHLTQPNTAMGVTYITFDTPDSPDQVIAFYHDKATAAGYQPLTGDGTSKDGSGNTTLTLMKGNALFLVVVKSNDDGSTNVTVSWM